MTAFSSICFGYVQSCVVVMLRVSEEANTHPQTANMLGKSFLGDVEHRFEKAHIQFNMDIRVEIILNKPKPLAGFCP